MGVGGLLLLALACASGGPQAPRAPGAETAGDAPAVRVLLASGPGPFRVRGTTAGDVTVAPGPRGVRVDGTDRGERVQLEGQALAVSGLRVRGVLDVQRIEGGVAVVNELPLEAYVAGTLARETYPTWGPEVLRAQAVVARTYALYQKQVADRAALADLFASTRSQKYLGFQYREGSKLIAGESDAGRKIAAATRGKVCHYHNKIFCTYYCAVCGGSTVRGTEVFADAAPPLVSVKCDYCREARLYRWTAEISKTDMQKELEPWLRDTWEEGAPTEVGKVRESR